MKSLEKFSPKPKAIALAMLATGSLAIGAAAVHAQALGALQGLKKGQWHVTERGATKPSHKLCLGNPSALIQLGHRGAACERYVIENKPNSVRVSYKCGARGHGVTSIRKESSGLVRIETQGIANNAPFSMAGEARRAGSC